MKNILIDLNATDEKELNIIIEHLINTRLVELDREYKPIRIQNKKNSTFIVRGKATEENLIKLSELPYVYKIWNDTIVEPFCKCNSSTKGTLNKVADCIGAKNVWTNGYSGKGIIVGIVDGGVSKEEIPEVINGSSPDWGTNLEWNKHGNMCATDTIGVAPDVKIYDLKIASTTQQGTISNALQAYEWAINQYNIDGTPHVLSNSWGIYQEIWDLDYATNPNHPFTLKVLEVIELGIKVLFAAGNCGRTCPDGIKLGKHDVYGNLNGRCNEDTGGGKDIWGANGLKEVMTIGAVKLNNKRLQYSSQGPAALFDTKPDFCGYSSFKGYFPNLNSTSPKDGGTSAACPIVAGCVALLLNYDQSLTQSQIQTLLKETAKDIENVGFDYNTGYGIVQIDKAYYQLNPTDKPKPSVKDRICGYIYRTERKCVKWKEEKTKQCLESEDQGYKECKEYKDEGYEKCSKWKEEKTKQCCTWWPCSWLCKAWTWIVSTICVAWVWVSNLVCIAWTWVSKIVCIVWIWIATLTCKLYLNLITIFTFTNCKCRTV